MKVTRADWPPDLEIQPKPMRSARRLAYVRRLSPEETDLLVRGFRPRAMEDHWFIFEEGDVLHLYRSWTGFHSFAISLRRLADGGAEIAEVAVNDEYALSTQVEEFDDGAEAVLDVFFDSLSATPTRKVDLPEYVYGFSGSAPETRLCRPDAFAAFVSPER